MYRSIAQSAIQLFHHKRRFLPRPRGRRHRMKLGHHAPNAALRGAHIFRTRQRRIQPSERNISPASCSYSVIYVASVVALPEGHEHSPPILRALPFCRQVSTHDMERNALRPEVGRDLPSWGRRSIPVVALPVLECPVRRTFCVRPVGPLVADKRLMPMASVDPHRATRISESGRSTLSIKRTVRHYNAYLRHLARRSNARVTCCYPGRVRPTLSCPAPPALTRIVCPSRGTAWWRS